MALKIVSNNQTLNNLDINGDVSYSLYGYRNVYQPEVLEFPECVLSISICNEDRICATRGGWLVSSLNLELKDGSTHKVSIRDNGKTIGIIEPKPARRKRYNYASLSALTVKAGDLIGIDSVFRHKEDSNLIVRLARLEDVRYGMQYTPLGPRGPSLHQGCFTGEVAEIKGLGHYYGKGLITEELLSSWDVIVKTNQAGNFHI